MMGKSKVSKMKQDKDCTTSMHTSVVQLELPLFVTVESVPVNKKTTCKDKSSICNPSTQKRKSSKTSGQDLTLKEKDCAPYWTEYCKEISSRLLLPVGTDYADLDSSLYSTWLSPTVEKSWFLTKLYTVYKVSLQPIFSQSSRSSLVECTDSGSTVKKSRKIRIFLNREQRAKLKKWFGVSRLVYNTTIKYLQQPDTEAYTSKTVSWTGEVLPKLGGSKTLTSKIDGRSIPRDLNGARRIFLRAVVDTPSLK